MLNDVIVKFCKSPQGLYYHDTRVRQLTMLNTVENNKLSYSKRELADADKARNMFGMVGYPSVQDYENMVKFNLLDEWTILVQDIQIGC